VNGQWSFDDREFVVAWNDRNGDIVPPPLMVTSRTPLLVDYQQELAEIRRRMDLAGDTSLHGVLDAVARPDVRIVVHGMDGRSPESPGSHVVLLAILSCGNGYLVKQRMGETVWHSEGFTITECDAPGLAKTVVAQLPEARAGRLGNVTLVEPSAQSDGMDYSYGRPAWRGSFEDTDEQRSHQFLAAAATSVGMIEVAQGHSRFGPRGISRHVLRWRDIEDDGRYLIAPEHPPVAVAADSTRCAAMIDSAIARVVRALEDENS
jgi:hypothetical protein